MKSRAPTKTPETRLPTPTARGLALLCTLALAIGLGGLPRQAAAQCNMTNQFEACYCNMPGNINIGSDHHAAAIAGDILYLNLGISGEGDWALSTIDISNPNSPVVVGLWMQPATSTIASISPMVALGTLLVGVDEGNLVVIDMTNPNSPVVIGSLDLAGDVKALELGGNTIYAHSNGRVDAISVADPFNPQSIGAIAIAGNASSDSLGTPKRDMLPVRANNTLSLVDISDPTNLTLLGSAPFGGYYDRPTIAGNAVVATDEYNLHILDITDPANPVVMPTIPDPNADDNGTIGGHASGSVWYAVGLFPDQVLAIDFLDPASPVILDQHEPIPSQAAAVDLRISGSSLVIVGLGDLALVDISTCAVVPSILSHPVCQIGDEGGLAIQLNAVTSLAVTHQWYRDGQPVSDGASYSGATTSTLTIQPSEETVGTYELVAINGDETATSLPAIVAVRNAAPDPTGGCAFSGDECIVVVETECVTAAGTYLGDGTDCSTYVPDATGACDFSGGECLVVTEANCALVSGAYLGDDTDCSSNGPISTGACNFSSGDCLVVTAASCALAGGDYEGDETDCVIIQPTITNTTQGTTHPTLYDAIFSSNQNDVIEIGEGRLVEWGIAVGNRDVIVRGQGRDKTIIDAAYSGTFLTFHSANHSSIEDLTIRRGLGNALKFVGNTRPTLRRVDIRDCVGGAAVRVTSQQIARFFGCRFIDNTSGIGGQVPSGLDLSFGANVKCINCVFSGNAGGARTIGTGSGVFDLVNCTFADNTDDWAVSGVGSPSVQNCVFDGSNPVGSVNPVIPVEHSLMPGSTGTNIDGVPTFVDAANGDYRLAAGSLGIDAADYGFYDSVVGSEGAFDVNGDDRLYDDTDVADTGVGALTYLDMGAYESQPETTEPDFCLGDMNGDGAIDGLDTQLFVAALLDGTLCP